MEIGVVVLWWVTVVGFAVVGLPIAATILGRLPDRGASVALPISLVTFGLTVYWVGHLSFGTVAIGAGVAVVGIGAILTGRRRPPIDWDRFVEWLVVFTAAFLLIVGIKYVDPSIVPIHPGERLLDYGILQTHLRADRLPAEDVWLAGEHLQYYYGGHMLIAALSMLSTVPAKFAFNLGVATTYAALLAGAYGVAGGITAERGGSFRHGGVLGALFVGVSSNLAPVVQAILYILPDGVAQPVATWIAGQTKLPAPWLLGNIGFGPDSYWSYYWAPSRVIRGTINEFPFFAFFNGDLHAHMLSQPFLVLAIAIAFAYFLTPGDRLRERRLLVFAALPPVAGWLAITNTWSFPSAVGVLGIAIYFAPSDPRELLPGDVLRGNNDRRPELRRLAGTGLAFIGVLILGALAVAPFLLIPERPEGVADEIVGIVTRRSTLLETVLVHGWMLGVFAGYLWLRVADRIDDREKLAIFLVLVVIVGAALEIAAFALVLPIALTAWHLLRRTELSVGFETALMVAGAGLVLLVEIVFLQDQAGPGRFNTVFKSYAHVWILWGIAAASALATINTGRFPTLDRERRRKLWSILTVVLVVSTAIYGAVAVAILVDNSEVRTLDGTHAIQQQQPAVWEAVQYLEDRPGQPNIVTAPSGPYRWGSAPASFSGVPTVITGMHHVRSFQGPAVVETRVRAVEQIYTGTTETRHELIDRYNVEYVWVGPWVQREYGASGITVAADNRLEIVFENAAVTIYAVRDSDGQT